MTVTERVKGVYAHLGLVPTLVLAGVLAVIVWYAVGGFADWYDSRAARNEAEAQKAIAAQAKKDADAAHADAEQKAKELAEQKGRADALEQKAAQLERDRDGLVSELDGAHAATENARRSYDDVRAGRAPRRPPAATPDDDRKRRERELCELYPDQCNR